MYIIDIHSHILPGIDDGPRTMDETMEMLEIAYEQGVRAIFATPHCGLANPRYDQSTADIILEAAKRESKKRFPDLLICRGNELFYSVGIVEQLHQGKVSTLAGTDYVLVEFAPDIKYKELEKAVRALITGGYRPIVAHAERYMCLLQDIDLVETLIRQGAYIQINSRTFLRKRFDKQMSWAKKLVKRGMVHFVATDSHNTKGRSPEIEEALYRLMKITDEDTVNMLVFGNGMKLLKNQYI